MDESPGVEGDRPDPAAEAAALQTRPTCREGPVPARAAARSAKGLGRGARAGARITGRSGHASARLVGRGGRASARRFRVFTHSGGAGESGLARLVELNAVHSRG